MSSSSSSAPSSPKTSNNKRKHAVGNVNSDTSDADSGSGSDSEDDKPASVAEDDIPVLSHAAKRKQKREEEKRKRKQESNEEDPSVMKKKRKLKNGSAAAAPQDVAGDKGLKRQNSTWVGNMTFKTTEENLRTFFRDRGVGEVTRIHMPMKAAKGPGLKMENRGSVISSSLIVVNRVHKETGSHTWILILLKQSMKLLRFLNNLCWEENC